MSVRLSDGALSRDVFPHDYHCLDRGNEVLPVKWMALETLTTADGQQRPYSTASDVVSGTELKVAN
jgi:hypothetical protein